MNEVSCRVFEVFVRPLADKGVDFATIVRGTSVPVEKLRNKKERIDWNDFAAIMRNMRPLFSDDEYVAIGRSFMHAKSLRFAMLVARLAFSPIDIYRWSNKPREGLGNQMFTCVAPSYREISANELVLDLTVPEGFADCWDFFVIVKGNNVELPCLFGLPPADVKLSRIPGGGRMEITVPTWRVPLLKRAWRIITWPFTARSAGRELKEAHETLVERFAQLEDARAKLDRQASQLRTAHKVSELAQRDLDLNRTLDSLTAALVEAGFEGAAIRLASGPHSTAGIDVAAAGMSRALTARSGHVLGTLDVVKQHDEGEGAELLTLVTPTIAIALENAVYRTGLETLVEQRTAELASAVDQLREAQTARERFFANVSHEFRTPLTLIMLAAKDIEARSGRLLDVRSSQSLVSVSDASRKLVRLVDELLLLAAGQEGKFDIHREPTDVGALITQLGAAWRPAAEHAGLELVVVTPASLVVNIDPVAFERVASNLVSNAVKYTPHGGTVEIELAAHDTAVTLVVRDNGSGISEDLAKRLFGRFERGAGDRRIAGTGIGLSLVKQLVEGHQGTIEAKPRESGGTEMRVTLPRGAAVSAPAPMRGLQLVSTAKVGGIANGTKFPAAGISHGTIVIAEDDAGLAEATARLLSEKYTVYVGLDGLAALELVKQHQPQLLVTDIDMPNLNGIELAKRFRDAVGDQLAPIIMLSAVIDLGTRIAGLEAGAIDYVTKPFEPRELMARVDAQFRMRELAVQLQQAEQLSTLGILTSGLAHEIRNPANGIVNAIGPIRDLLPGELIGPETGPGQLLEVMEECATQIRFLSKQLLGFRSGMQLEVTPVTTSEVVSRSLSLAQSSFSGVEIRTPVGVSGMLRCSVPLLVQAVTNLLDNAAQAAGRGGWVEISTFSDGDRLSVEVADSGPGVPLALRDKIFQPFFTTKAPGEGTGIGLAMARAIVQRHGGKLEIRERDGRAAFVIDLPVDSFTPSAHARYDERAIS